MAFTTADNQVTVGVDTYIGFRSLEGVLLFRPLETFLHAGRQGVKQALLNQESPRPETQAVLQLSRTLIGSIPIGFLSSLVVDTFSTGSIILAEGWAPPPCSTTVSESARVVHDAV